MWLEPEEQGAGEEGRRGWRQGRRGWITRRWITKGLQLFQQVDFCSEQDPVPCEGLECSIRIWLIFSEAQLGCCVKGTCKSAGVACRGWLQGFVCWGQEGVGALTRAVAGGEVRVRSAQTLNGEGRADRIH